MTRVAVVTIAHGRHQHLGFQHESLARGSRRPDLYVAVAMDDAGIGPADDWGLHRSVLHVEREPLGLPLAAARNTGVRHALRSGADVVVLLDVDCLAGSDLVSAYAAQVTREPDTFWSGPVTYLGPPEPGGYVLDRLPLADDPHPARPDPGPSRVLRGADPDLFWSLSFACSRTAWTRAGGFCEDYVGYGAEDTDLGQRVVEAGLDHGVLGDARAYHQWHPTSSPPVQHLDDILRNAAIFHERWGRWPMTGWLEAFADAGLVVRRDGRWQRADGAPPDQR